MLFSGPWVPSSVLGGNHKKAVGFGSLPISVEAHPHPNPCKPSGVNSVVQRTILTKFGGLPLSAVSLLSGLSL